MHNSDNEPQAPTSDDRPDGSVEGVRFNGFGVGCFHFAAKNTAQDFDYRTSLTAFLNKHQFISNVKISDGSKFFPNSNEHFKSNEDLSAETINPISHNAEISFTVRIPKRTQKELIGDWREEIETEHFDILISYQYSLPVTFVFNDCELSRPSSAVSLMWKFFEKHLLDDHNIEFQMIGPSPFHAEFLCTLSNESEISIRCSKSYGYDHIFLNLPEGLVDDYRDIAPYVLGDVMSDYYYLISVRNKINRSFFDLSSRVDAFLESVEKTGHSISKSSSTYIFSEQIELEKLAIDAQSLTSFFNSRERDVSRFNSRSKLWYKFQEELDSISSIPIVGQRKILRSLERSKSQFSQSYVAFMSALLGAFIMAIATVAVPYLASLLSN